MNLEGTTCLVTGANRGIGQAIAQALAETPLELLLCGTRSPEQGVDVTAPAGGAREVRAVRMQLAGREQIDNSCDELGETLDAIDLLVNNAGLMTGGLLEEQDTEEIYAMLQVNLTAVMHLTKRVLPGMVRRGTGKIVNNASISGYAHFPAASTYAASKAGVVAFSESLRRELRGTGVSMLHLVTPGVETDMLAATEELYGRHLDTSDWDRVPAPAWGAKVLEAIRSDATVLNPPGKTRLAKLASRGPGFLLDRASAQMFSRDPRA